MLGCGPMSEMNSKEINAEIVKEIDSVKKWLDICLATSCPPPWMTEDDIRCVARTGELLLIVRGKFESR
jgi:hypothetical protein